ncbi:MAG: DUF2218 domain-containing protein, partial [Aliidongia sp.]
MPISEARIETAHSQRYLGQLCKHFGHRIPATYTDDSGRIEFPSGICSLSAAPGLLVLRTEAQDDLARRLLEGVVGSHLERFAFRETLEIVWGPHSAEA